MSTDEMHRLRTAASAVTIGAAKGPRAQISARQAARCLSGVVLLVTEQYGPDVTRQACALLATSPDAWKSRQHDAVGTAVWTIAVLARGILPLCGDEAMASALAFWASETDPEAMRVVCSGVAA